MTPKSHNSGQSPQSEVIELVLLNGGCVADHGERPKKPDEIIGMKIGSRKVMVDYQIYNNCKVTIGAFVDDQSLGLKTNKHGSTDIGVIHQAAFEIPTKAYTEARDEGKDLHVTAKWADGFYKEGTNIPWKNDQISRTFRCIRLCKDV